MGDMYGNDTPPDRLLYDLRREGRRLLVRSDLCRLGTGHPHLEEVITQLVEDGLIDRIDKELWLIPSEERPRFEKSRFWSNPDLMDPGIICAIVVSKPTIRDVTRILLAYGRRTVEDAFEAARADGAMSPHVQATTRRMIDNAWEGIGNAARRAALRRVENASSGTG